jgi:C4-dicarboxylate transporter, DctM subunit
VSIVLWMTLTAMVPLLIGIPIGLSLGAGGLLWLILLDPNYLRGVGHTVWNGLTGDVLISIPLFMLMGELVQRCGLASRFYDAVAIWLRRLPGGLFHANIAATSVFSAISGSSVATAATIGMVALPNMERMNYDKRLTVGSLAAGGTLGILIPPSIPLIIYGAMVEVSVGQLFMAALIPGIMMALIFSAYIAIVSLLHPEMAPAANVPPPTMRQRLQSLVEMGPLLLVVVLILGGIYLGWTTTSEAATVGTVATMAIALVQRRLSWRILVDSFSAAVRFTAMLMFVIVGAQIFSFAVFSWGLTGDMGAWISSLDYPPLVILIIIVAIYVILGTFIDELSIMIMTLSILFPVIVHLGYDPVWFGVLLVLLLEIGLISPPVGLNLSTIQALQPGKITMKEVSLGALPFVFLLLLGIALLIAFPDIALWLPRQMF